jgi:hypothetical protein
MVAPVKPQLKIFKTDALPAQPQANAVYFVQSAGDDGLVDLWVTSATGVPRRALNKSDVQRMLEPVVAQMQPSDDPQNLLVTDINGKLFVGGINWASTNW